MGSVWTGLLMFAHGVDKLHRWLGKNVAWVILIVVCISASNAVLRKFFGVSSNAWLELQWYLFGAIFLLAAGYTLLNNEHVRVDVLAARWSEITQIKIELFGTLCFLLPMCLTILWLSWPMAAESWVTREMSSNSGGLLRWPVKLLIPLGFTSLLLASLSHAIKLAGFLASACPNPLKRVNKQTAEELLAQDIAAQTTAGGHPCIVPYAQDAVNGQAKNKEPA